MSQYSLDDLLTLMARLREPDYGCPWDIKQNYQSIVPSTIEEVYEVVDAIETEDYPHLKEELGDLLFQIVFYSQLAKEDEFFDFHQVIHGITEKLIRRHPHVFPEGTLDSRIDLSQSADEKENAEQTIKANWEAIKKQEREKKGKQGILDDIPLSLPATLRATKLQKRASSIGFDWHNVEGVMEKVTEEWNELNQAIESGKQGDIEEELGDVFFTLINLSRHLKVDVDNALRVANKKFEGRFGYIENQAQQSRFSLQSNKLSDLPTTTLEQWWEQAKKHEKTRSTIHKTLINTKDEVE